MFNLFSGENFNDLYIDLVKYLRDNYDYKVNPRGMETKEIVNPIIVLENPKKSLITLKNRKLNYAFSIIEKFQYLSGYIDYDRTCFYNSNYSNFSNSKKEFDGDYGKRIAYQIKHIYNLIKNDKDTRQAVISIYNMFDDKDSKDIPCTLNLHFYVRENKLHLTTYMRSNDLYWGLCYDINAFSYIQRILASSLGLELGRYAHTSTSFHYYTDLEDKILDSISSNEIIDFEEFVNPEIEKDIDLDRYILEIKMSHDLEKKLRETYFSTGKILDFDDLMKNYNFVYNSVLKQTRYIYDYFVKKVNKKEI